VYEYVGIFTATRDGVRRACNCLHLWRVQPVITVSTDFGGCGGFGGGNEIELGSVELGSFRLDDRRWCATRLCEVRCFEAAAPVTPACLA
jgi:hypothetical protein